MKNLTEGNIYKNFILFAIPLVLSGLLTQAFNIINTVVAGKYLGDAGLAATGATAGFFSFYGAIFWGWGMGFSINIAKLFGEKNYKKIKSNIFSNVFMLFILMTLAGIIMAIFKNPLLDMLNVDNSVRNEASKYFLILITTYFIAIMRVWGVYIFNSFGMSAFPFMVSLISSIFSTVAKVISLTVLNMGVSALAVITQLTGLIVITVYYIKLKKCFSEMGVNKEKYKVDFKEIKDTVSYAAPTTFQQMVMAVVSFLISPLVNAIGSSASAAYSVVMNIYNLNAQVYQHSAKTVSNYAAQCVGTRKFYNLKKGVKVGFLQGICFLTPVLLICIIFARPICSMYFPKGYAGESLSFTLTFVKFYLPFIAFNMINNLFHAFYRGVVAMKALVSATVIGTVTRLIPTILLIPVYGMTGVYIGWAVSWIAEAIFTVIVYFSGIWKKEKINKIIKEENLETV